MTGATDRARVFDLSQWEKNTNFARSHLGSKIYFIPTKQKIYAGEQISRSYIGRRHDL